MKIKDLTYILAIGLFAQCLFLLGCPDATGTTPVVNPPPTTDIVGLTLSPTQSGSYSILVLGETNIKAGNVMNIINNDNSVAMGSNESALGSKILLYTKSTAQWKGTGTYSVLFFKESNAPAVSIFEFIKGASGVKFTNGGATATLGTASIIDYTKTLKTNISDQALYTVFLTKAATVNAGNVASLAGTAEAFGGSEIIQNIDNSFVLLSGTGGTNSDQFNLFGNYTVVLQKSGGGTGFKNITFSNGTGSVGTDSMAWLP
ncbi:hypothetical protein AGMMS50212_04020 [Spirochaetia bacterium]|nr:hypothetical protein AGMMS50212_04020 [Spirochaetia bacterium]